MNFLEFKYFSYQKSKLHKIWYNCSWVTLKGNRVSDSFIQAQVSFYEI